MLRVILSAAAASELKATTIILVRVDKGSHIRFTSIKDGACPLTKTLLLLIAF
nr:AlNc14C209G8879 [Albugo laibachii Nc14]|eukprot:CCA23832.1 AlNc14C209G8879 [Albugo laibachii Nc14]